MDQMALETDADRTIASAAEAGSNNLKRAKPRPGLSNPPTAECLDNKQKRPNMDNYLNLRPKIYEDEYGTDIHDFDTYMENMKKLTRKFGKRKKNN